MAASYLELGNPEILQHNRLCEGCEDSKCIVRKSYLRYVTDNNGLDDHRLDSRFPNKSVTDVKNVVEICGGKTVIITKRVPRKRGAKGRFRFKEIMYLRIIWEN